MGFITWDETADSPITLLRGVCTMKMITQDDLGFVGLLNVIRVEPLQGREPAVSNIAVQFNHNISWDEKSSYKTKVFLNSS